MKFVYAYAIHFYIFKISKTKTIIFFDDTIFCTITYT